MKRLLLSPDANVETAGASSASGTQNGNNNDANGQQSDQPLADADIQSAIDQVLSNAGVDSSTTKDGDSDSKDSQQGEETIDDQAPEGDVDGDDNDQAEDSEEDKDGEGEVEGKATTTPKTLAEQKQDAEDAKLPFHNHPRWKAVTAERDTARANLVSLQTEHEKAKPLVEAQKGIVDFCQSNDIEPAHLQEALQFLALSRKDPAKALETIEQYRSGLAAIAGKGIAPDLMKAVQSGEVSEAYAQEITKMRANELLQQHRQQRGVESAAKQQADAVNNTVASWVNNRMATDPDFKAKQPFLNGIFAADVQSFAIANKRNPSQNEVVTLLEQSVKKVEDGLKPFGPKKTAIKQPLRGGNRTTPRAVPDTYEGMRGAAISAVLAKHRG